MSIASPFGDYDKEFPFMPLTSCDVGYKYAAAVSGCNMFGRDTHGLHRGLQIDRRMPPTHKEDRSIAGDADNHYQFGIGSTVEDGVIFVAHIARCGLV